MTYHLLHELGLLLLVERKLLWIDLQRIHASRRHGRCRHLLLLIIARGH